jgi:hypothetical protein
MVGQPLSALYDGYQYMSTMDFKHTGIPVLFYGKEKEIPFLQGFQTHRAGWIDGVRVGRPA